jgi:murein DD-endopeptidase MepM/ murein hydrolase activator NlpD
MKVGSVSQEQGLLPRIRHLFRNRELFVHDGAAMRRVHVSSRMQIAGATVAAVAAFGAVLTIGQLAVGAVGLSKNVAQFASSQSDMMAMEARVAALKADVVAVKTAAREHAARLEARQAGLAALIAGHANDETLLSMVPAIPKQANADAADVALAFSKLDRQQVEMAAQLQHAAEARYAATEKLMGNLGLNQVAMGGPYEPVSSAAAAPTATATALALPASTPAKADPQFRALFDSWKRLDAQQTSMISIPSQKPVDQVSLTSGYGVRSDPFRGGRAMHAGVDIPGPIGTPIYATADAIVGRAGWIGGYGNMIELEHGKSIQTRYGHLSSIQVAPGQRIKRGQLIGLMGSTGRSTGSHLHYEVRLDGKAVNPIPFLRTADYLFAMQRRAGSVEAMGGPAEGAAK